MSPADLDEVAAPYRTLLETVGGGIELTASGYLPAPVVQALCPALDIDPILAGKANRESNVSPLLMFRGVLQGARLLRVRRRTLEPTEAGASLVDQLEERWRHVAASLPHADGELERDGAWFTLLAVAGGVGMHRVYDEVGDLCADAGWVGEDDQPISRWAATALVWPVLASLMGARWNSLESWPAWGPAAAATVIFGDRGD